MTAFDDLFNEKDDAVEKRKKVGGYVLGRTLGKGSFAKVRLGVHLISRQRVAVKVISKRLAKKREYVRRNMRREAIILQRLQHPNIVQLHEVLETDNSFYLVTELADGGEMIKYLNDRKSLSEAEARRFLRQLVSAVDHMHRVGVIHRDLKVENLLLDRDMNLKLIDFGLSNFWDGDSLLQTQCGSPAYAAPEVFSKRSYGPLVDVWSIGVNLFAMLTGRLPFVVDPPTNLTRLHSLILKGPKIPANLSGGCQDLLYRMLQPQVSLRITIKEILKHPWFNDGYVPLPSPPRCISRMADYELDQSVIQHVSQLLAVGESTVREAVLGRRPIASSANYNLLCRRLAKGLKLPDMAGESSPGASLHARALLPVSVNVGLNHNDTHSEISHVCDTSGSVHSHQPSRDSVENCSNSLGLPKLSQAGVDRFNDVHTAGVVVKATKTTATGIVYPAQYGEGEVLVVADEKLNEADGCDALRNDDIENTDRKVPPGYRECLNQLLVAKTKPIHVTDGERVAERAVEAGRGVRFGGQTVHHPKMTDAESKQISDRFILNKIYRYKEGRGPAGRDEGHMQLGNWEWRRQGQAKTPLLLQRAHNNMVRANNKDAGRIRAQDPRPFPQDIQSPREQDAIRWSEVGGVRDIASPSAPPNSSHGRRRRPDADVVSYTDPPPSTPDAGNCFASTNVSGIRLEETMDLRGVVGAASSLSRAGRVYPSSQLNDQDQTEQVGLKGDVPPAVVWELSSPPAPPGAPQLPHSGIGKRSRTLPDLGPRRLGTLAGQWKDSRTSAKVLSQGGGANRATFPGPPPGHAAWRPGDVRLSRDRTRILQQRSRDRGKNTSVSSRDLYGRLQLRGIGSGKSTSKRDENHTINLSIRI